MKKGKIDQLLTNGYIAFLSVIIVVLVVFTLTLAHQYDKINAKLTEAEALINYQEKQIMDMVLDGSKKDIEYKMLDEKFKSTFKQLIDLEDKIKKSEGQ